MKRRPVPHGLRAFLTAIGIDPDEADMIPLGDLAGDGGGLRSYRPSRGGVRRVLEWGEPTLKVKPGDIIPHPHGPNCGPLCAGYAMIMTTTHKGRPGQIVPIPEHDTIQ
jgi:hypothetical protein